MARGTLRLKASAGTDEANFGTERFRVDNDGHIDVPPEAAEALLDKGGFVVDDPSIEPPVAPEGMVVLAHASDPSASFSFDGESYEPDENGHILAPAAAAAHLAPHGFHPVVAAPAPEPAE